MRLFRASEASNQYYRDAIENEVRERTLLCQSLKERLDRLTTTKEPYLWLDEYESLPCQSFESVGNELSDWIQQMSFLRWAYEEVPEEVQLNIPNTVDELRAREARQRSLWSHAVELHKLLDGWLVHRAYQIGPSETATADFVRETLAVTILSLRSHEILLEATARVWSDNVAGAKMLEEEAMQWLHIHANAQGRLDMTFAVMSEAEQEQVKAIGWTPEMWEMLGIDVTGGTADDIPF